jgi:t-SNARE complex subunit (syntaxin)
MNFCPVVPEICLRQVHGPRKERRKRIIIIIIIIIIIRNGILMIIYLIAKDINDNLFSYQGY